MPRTVYVTRELPHPGTAPLVASGLEIDQHAGDLAPDRDELVSHLASAHAVLCMLTEQMDARAMDAAPHLQIIANLAVGFDNIDVAAATERGIVVTNTPDVLTEATADLTWALLMATARRIGEGERLVRSGAWNGWGPTQLVGQPVWGATLGVVGLGKIGTAVARRGRGFGMEVVYHSRSRHADVEDELGVSRVPLDELLEMSDFVSLHAPLDEASRHMIDGRALASMKSTAVLVNTGRGQLVDEGALVEALRYGVIAGAGLDVFEDEPLLHEGLSRLPNVVVTPHVGSATTATRSTMVQLCCDNIIRVLDGATPLTPVNPEVLTR